MPDERHPPASRRYRLHGLGIESDLELPELISDAGPDTPADVRVRVGRVSERLEGGVELGACCAGRPGEMLFRLPGTARFRVSHGDEIVVDPDPGVAEDTLRSLILSSPVAALLLQRGLLPLHASAVAAPGGAIVMAGAASSGKSTLAAALLQRGLRPLSDDITAVRIGPGGPPAVLPGYPVLRLWPAALAGLGASSAGRPLRAGVDKRLVPCGGDFPSDPVPIIALAILERRERGPREESLRRLAGSEAAAAIIDAVYRMEFAHVMGLDGPVFERTAALVRGVRVARFVAESGGNPPTRLARVLCETLAP